MQFQAILLRRIYRLKGDKKPIFLSLLFSTMIVCWGKICRQLLTAPQTLIFFPLLAFQFFLLMLSVDQIVSDRQKHKLHVLRVMGLRSVPYWLANLIFDFVIQLPLILGYLLSYYKLPKLLTEQIVMFGVLIVLYSINMIIFCYHLSRWFKSSDYISSAVVIITLTCWQILSRDDDNYDVFDLVSCIKYGIFLIPQLSLYPGFWTLEQLASILNLDPKKTDLWHIFYFNLGFLGIVTLVQFCYILQRNFNLIERKRPAVSEDGNLNISNIADQDILVENEQNRINAEINQDLIKFVDVEKAYMNGCHAVEKLSFGIESGQIFCLIGPNGAGKTTTFDILTQKIRASSGQVYIQGQELDKVKKGFTFGLCLQSDTLWTSLTVRQHLRIYSLMKGLKKKETLEAIEYLINKLGLKEHAEKRVKNLSSGTKRKLSVALALIGGPEIIILDEATTGVDPVGRNQIWELLKLLSEKRKTTVFISTHYMEDAELVADRLGILVSGRLESVGRVAELRKKYEEYSVIIKNIEDDSVEYIKEIVKNIIPKAKASINQKGLMFKVPPKVMKFSQLFIELENLKSERMIEDFSICITTLEQVFLRYAKKQIRS